MVILCRTVIAFGLNALYNRKKVASGAWGPWNSSNAYDLIQYTVDQGFEVQAWELGEKTPRSFFYTNLLSVSHQFILTLLVNTGIFFYHL